MPPKSAASAAPAPRQDLPWALSILSNPEADPVQLPAALTFLASLSPPQFPQEVEPAVQLITLATPFMCANDASASAAAIRLVTRLATRQVPTDAATGMAEALRQPAVVQAFWAVPAYFHASFDAYTARLAAIQQESRERPPSAPVTASPTKKPDSRAAAKVPPPAPVDPESTLPGPSKFALDAALRALTAAVGQPFAPGFVAVEAAVTEVVGRDVTPLLSLLKHHSSRIQVLTLRLLRQLLRCEPLAVALDSAGGTSQLVGLLAGSPFGVVREEVLRALSRMMAATGLAMQHALDAGLPTLLLKHILAPTTGAPGETPAAPLELPPPGPLEKPERPQGSPRGQRLSTPRGSHQGQAPSQGRPSTPSDGEATPRDAPAGPPPIDFSTPMISAPERLQELSVQLLQVLTEHLHGAVQELLRQGGLQLLLALLPAPQLPDLPPPPARKRASSASDTFFAHMMGRGRPSGSGSGAAPPPPLPPRPKDAWQPFLDAAPSLPLPLPAARLQSHSLQASLLRSLACLLAEPGVQDWLWSVHPTKRQHLQLLFMLQTEPLPKPEPVSPPPAATPSRRASAVVPEPPPDPTQPPFPPEVRAAVLHCLLQLAKHPSWLDVVPSLIWFQNTVRDQDSWDPRMVAPLTEILQRILQQRQPPPPRAAAAAPAAARTPGTGGDLRGSSDGGGGLPPHQRPRTAQNPFPPPAPNGLPAESNGLADQELSTEELTEALKALARVAKQMGDPRIVSVVSSALLVLPESTIFAPPWPPLPSPPPTPPPPPLPTSQYLWDALGRPVMTDGIKLQHL